jgi:mono/diheme cytochrome c family protein/plastocyanin
VLEPARRQVKWVATIAAAAGLVVLGGCGGGGGDPKTGKQLFVQSCGSCHTLADANTKGAIGPDLDQAFAQSVRDGLGRDTIRGVVREQISLPLGAMPADLVKGKDADSVAAYVAEVAAKPGAGGGGGATGGGGSGGGGTAKASASNQLDIPTDPSGQLAYQVKKATAKPGKVTLRSKNDASVPHDIAIKGDGKGPVVQGGKVSEVSTTLKAGSYEFHCSVPGHEQAGMKGTLTVK